MTSTPIKQLINGRATKAWPSRVKMILDHIETGHHNLAASTLPLALSEMLGYKEDGLGELLLSVMHRADHMSCAAQLADAIQLHHRLTPLVSMLTPAALTRLRSASPRPGHPIELFLAPLRTDVERDAVIRRFLSKNNANHVRAVLYPIISDKPAFWTDLAIRDQNLLIDLSRTNGPKPVFLDDLLEAIAVEAYHQHRSGALLPLVDIAIQNISHHNRLVDRCQKKMVEVAVRLASLPDPNPARLFIEKAILPYAGKISVGLLAKLIVKDAAIDFTGGILTGMTSKNRWSLLDLLVRCEVDQLAALLPCFSATWSSTEINHLHKAKPIRPATIVDEMCARVDRVTLSAAVERFGGIKPKRVF